MTPSGLRDAYHATTYQVDIAGVAYPMRIGRRHPDLDARLREAQVKTWACITAYNPQSKILPARENKRRDAELKRALQVEGLQWHSTTAVADGGEWPPEAGVLALGISRARAVRLAREFDQAAIVWGEVDGKAELVWCTPLRHRTRA